MSFIVIIIIIALKSKFINWILEMYLKFMLIHICFGMHSLFWITVSQYYRF